nr:helix-turn-helix transcriptional regulator [Enterocloster clostridioformis]
MAKRPVPLYDFKAFGAAIKAARNEYGESRKKVSDELYISPRYLANIENKGQQPSLQVFYDLVTRYHISVDQFFFPNSNAEKSTGRRQLDALLDGIAHARPDRAGYVIGCCDCLYQNRINTDAHKN